MATNGFYTVQEAADKLGIAVRTVRQWIRDGKLKATTYGEGTKRLWIPKSEIDKKLAELRK